MKQKIFSIVSFASFFILPMPLFASTFICKNINSIRNAFYRIDFDESQKQVSGSLIEGNALVMTNFDLPCSISNEKSLRALFCVAEFDEGHIFIDFGIRAGKARLNLIKFNGIGIALNDEYQCS